MTVTDLGPRLRRIVTGLDAQGRSIAQIDGPPGAVVEWPDGGGLYEIWTDLGQALAREDGADQSVGPVTLSPPAGGMKVRWFTVAPVDLTVVSPEDHKAGAAAVFAQMGAAHEQPDTSRHPAMHLTPTIDVIIVISGRVRLLLDADERVLGPGDVVIQRGTNHAWICESETPAVLVAVLNDRTFA